MRSAYFYIFLGLFLNVSVVFTTGCSGLSSPPAMQPQLTFTQLQVANWQGADIKIINNYQSPIAFNVLDQEIKNNPLTSFYAWANRRFPAKGNNAVDKTDQLTFTINEARLIKEKETGNLFMSVFNNNTVLKAYLNITIDHIDYDPHQNMRREKSYVINVNRQKSLSAQSTIDDRDKAATSLVEQLIYDFDAKFASLNL